MWNNSLRELWNISLRSMWNEIRLFTFAKQIFHSEAISHGEAIFHSPKANFVEKSTHCLGRQMCAFFWRRRWDLNPRDAFTPYEISSHASSTTWVLLRFAGLLVCYRRNRGIISQSKDNCKCFFLFFQIFFYINFIFLSYSQKININLLLNLWYFIYWHFYTFVR